MHAFVVAASAAVSSSRLALRSGSRCITRCGGFGLRASLALRCGRHPEHRLWQFARPFGDWRTLLSTACRREGSRASARGVCSLLRLASAVQRGVLLSGSDAASAVWRARCLASARCRRLVTWRFGACFGLELHPVGGFFVVRRLRRGSACTARLRLRSASLVLGLVRRGCMLFGTYLRVRFGARMASSDAVRVRPSVAAATVVHGYRLRLVSCRDALEHRFSLRRVSYTAGAEWPPRWPVCASAHVHSVLRRVGGFDETGTHSGGARTAAARSGPFGSWFAVARSSVGSLLASDRSKARDGVTQHQEGNGRSDAVRLQARGILRGV
jgi:hypothetical protein